MSSQRDADNSNRELPTTSYPGCSSNDDFNTQRLSRQGGVGAVGSAGSSPLDVPSTSDDTRETINNQSKSAIDIGERFKNLIFDQNLIFDPVKFGETLKTLSKNNKDMDEKLKLDPYPSDSTLALLARKAYSDNPADETLQMLPEGWELLTIARNTDGFNGYFGAAFLCRALQQVVVAHRGTKCTNFGALWADAKSIMWNKETRHVCSAVTFTEAIVNALNESKVEGVSFQLSITGHSLGGWLAQVTTFTVKYLQRDELTLKLKLRSIEDGFHAHTVVFESPGCKRRLSKMNNKLHMPLEITKYSDCIKRLDISCYLSAPNRINTLKKHLGIIYRVKTDLSDLTTCDRWTHRYTTKTHSMEKMYRALEVNPEKLEMLDWPCKVTDNNFNKPNENYVFKAIDKNCCSMRIFSEDERLFLELWEKLMESNMNLTNLIVIKGLTVSYLFDEFRIDEEKQTIVCASEQNINKVIRQTKALMRWVPAEVLALVASALSSAKVMFCTAGDQYFLSLLRSRLDFTDTTGLETFLTSSRSVQIISTPDSDTEMARQLNIFSQIQENQKETIIYTNDKHYSFIDMKGIKKLESPVDIRRLFESCFQKDYLFFLQCTEHYKDVETILIEILNNLKSNRTNRLVLVVSPDTGFEDLCLKINNILIFNKIDTKEIKLSDLTKESVETFFEQKIIHLQGQRLSLREVVGEYHLLTPDQLNNVNTLLGTQIFKNFLFNENNLGSASFIGMNLNHNDLRVHSTLNKEVSLERVARALQRHSGAALLVISGISQEELETGRWRELEHGVGGEMIFTLARNGESVFLQKCRENPDSTVYWLAASAGRFYCKTIYEKGFYMKRRWMHQYIFKVNKFLDKLNNQDVIFVFQDVKDKQSLMVNWRTSEENKTTFMKNNVIKTAFSADEADGIIKGNPGRPVHILIQEGDQILWHHSRGSLEGFRTYVTADMDEFIDEEDLCETSQKVVIIADEPGMGKSTSLTSVSRLMLQSAWVIRVDLKDFQKPIKDLPAQLSLNSVGKFLLRGEDGLLQGLLQFCLDKQNVHSRPVCILFDGFDEIKQVSSEINFSAEDKVLKLLKYLSEESTARIWITTRLYRREILENALSTFAVRFEKISEKQQREFLVEFWRPHLLLETDQYGDAEESKLRECAEIVYEKAKRVLGNNIEDFMGIPLQMRMLAEVFMQRVKNYVKTESNIVHSFDVKSVLDLYEQFIEFKYEIYFGEKTELNDTMHENNKKIIIDHCTESHRLLGLHTLFSDFFKENFEDPENRYGAVLCRVGLVQSGGAGGENTEFLHRTLAEYFCADLVVHWLRKKGRYLGHAPMAELLLTKVFLEDSNKVVRIFINNLVLSQPLPADANNFFAMKISEIWKDKHHILFTGDLYGQTALHVAVKENNMGIMNILLGGLKCEPVQAISYIAARDRHGSTVLLQAAEERNNGIMINILQSLETCPNEVILQLLLATYTCGILKHELTSLNNYLHGEEYSEINRALIRTREIVQELIPPFLEAVKGGRMEEVKQLYNNMNNETERRCMLLAGDSIGRTALHFAAQDTNYEHRNRIIKILFKHKMPEIERLYDITGYAPLHCAAGAGNLDIVEHFINHHGVYIDSPSTRGETALFNAALSGSLSVVELLVQKGADIDIANDKGETSLFNATLSGKLQVVKLLIQKGSDINIINDKGETALFNAAHSGSLPVVELLLQKGLDINIINNEGDTALFNAVRSGSLPAVELLLRKGLDINIINYKGETALFSAAHSGSLPVVELLLQKGLDINIINNEGDTVLFNAAHSGSLPVVELLLQKGLDINIINYKGETALFNAVRSGSLPVVELLLRKRLDINIINYKGETALFKAALSGSPPVVELLIHKGLDINIINYKGETALFYAARSTSLPVVELLLQNGSDFNIINKNGETVLFTAAACYGNLPVVELLKNKGVDINIVNIYGKTALNAD